MSGKIFPTQLESLDLLFRSKNDELIQLIGNLQYDSLKDEVSFQNTLKSIRDKILLNKVVINSPKIGAHRFEQRSIRPNFDNLFGRSQGINIVTVHFPFTGSPEILKYKPNNLSFNSSDTGVYQPDFENSIDIEVEVKSMDRHEILSKAENELKTTKNILSQLNPQIEEWSLQVEKTIETKLRKRKQELDDLHKS